MIQSNPEVFLILFSILALLVAYLFTRVRHLFSCLKMLEKGQRELYHEIRKSHERTLRDCSYQMFPIEKEVAELRGQIITLREAPVLRQYIQKVVPVDMNDDYQRQMEQKMKKFERDLSQQYGFDSMNYSAPLMAGDRDPEDLV